MCDVCQFVRAFTISISTLDRLGNPSTCMDRGATLNLKNPTSATAASKAKAAPAPKQEEEGDSKRKRLSRAKD